MYPGKFYYEDGSFKLINNDTLKILKEFEQLVNKYPEVLKCIPTLLAVRQYDIIVLDDDGNKFEYNFKKMNYSIEQYKVFMRETGLFDLMQNHLVNNLQERRIKSKSWYCFIYYFTYIFRNSKYNGVCIYHSRRRNVL